jgi:hypothetical protein
VERFSLNNSVCLGKYIFYPHSALGRSESFWLLAACKKKKASGYRPQAAGRKKQSYMQQSFSLYATTILNFAFCIWPQATGLKPQAERNKATCSNLLAYTQPQF